MTVGLIVSALVLLPIPNLTPKVNSAPRSWEWLRITDDEFESNNYYVRNFVTFNDEVAFFTAQRELFGFMNGEVVQIPLSMMEDEDTTLVDFAFGGSSVIVITSNPDDGDKIWIPAYENIWEDYTEGLIGDIPNVVAIKKAIAYEGFILLQIDTDDGELYESRFYVVGQDFVEFISDSETFHPDIDPQSMVVVDVEPLVDEDMSALALLIRDESNNTDYIYGFYQGMWQLVTGFPAGDRVGDVEAIGDQIFITINREGVLTLEVFFQGDWIDTELEFAEGEYEAKLTSNEEYMFIGISNFEAGNARILSYDLEGIVEEEMGYIGEYVEGELESYSYITAMEAFGEGLIVAAGFPSEGPVNTNIWFLNPIEQDPEGDFDEDGQTNGEENSAPNDGDANNDGTPDSEQSNVISFMNSVTGQYTVLEHSCVATNSVVLLAESDNSEQDSAFEYPVGLIDFEISCDVGETATITQYFYGDYNSSLMILRKFKESIYSTVSEAVLTNETIADLPVLKIVYQITDGGELDDDNLENGIILDPVGAALNSAGVPNTGIGRRFSI